MWPHPPVHYVCLVDPAEVGTTTVLGVFKRGRADCMMSLKVCFLIGPFDSEAFSFQEETKNTQERQICTF